MDKLFKKYLNGTCSPEEYAKILQIIRERGNDQELDGFMKENWDAIEARAGDVQNKELLGRIHHQIALIENKSTHRSIRFYQVALRIAAVLIVGLIATTAFLYNYTNQFSQQLDVRHISTPKGAKTNFQLPDGTSVWLNSGSEIIFAGNFEKDRKVKLKGEAYFDVVKSGRTFQISTEYGNILVLGTAFDVKAYSEDNFITTLERGSLEVNTISGKEKHILKPGNQSFLDENNHLKIQEVDIREFTSWKDGKLMFKRKSLEEVVKMLELWYNVKIELEAKETKQLWFTGTIEMETISEVLEIIKTTIPIEYSFDSKTRIMKIKAK
jgi:transmembrane sensor